MSYQASRGWELDALQQIMSTTALTSHLLEKLNQLYTENEETEEEKQLKFEISELLKRTQEIRRMVTALLNPDTTWSCALKHASEVYQYSTECYLASDEYPFELVNKSYELFTGVISKALGHELEYCGRCFWDEAMAKKISKKED